MDAVPLPVLNCDGCSACCQHMGNPTGYAGFFLAEDPEGLAWCRKIFPVEWELMLAMPDELWQGLRVYYTERQYQDDTGKPCIWLDQANNRCRHHEWRPRVCRDFEVGGASCLNWRAVRAGRRPTMTTDDLIDELADLMAREYPGLNVLG